MEKIILLGDSLTEVFDTDKYLPEYKIINKGISGNKTSDVMARLHKDVISVNPDLVFLLIGTNDIGAGISEDRIIENLSYILTEIKKLPECIIYLSSILPASTEDRPAERINAVNERIKDLCSYMDLNYVDLHPHFADEKGRLKKEFTEDGLHLNSSGYEMWASMLKGILP